MQKLFDKKVCNNFSIGCRIEYVPCLLKLLPELSGVDYIAVMSYSYGPVLI